MVALGSFFLSAMATTVSVSAGRAVATAAEQPQAPPRASFYDDAAERTSMRPREWEAFQEVSMQCRDDVVYYCDHQAQEEEEDNSFMDGFLLISPPSMMRMSSSPFPSFSSSASSLFSMPVSSTSFIITGGDDGDHNKQGSTTTTTTTSFVTNLEDIDGREFGRLIDSLLSSTLERMTSDLMSPSSPFFIVDDPFERFHDKDQGTKRNEMTAPRFPSTPPAAPSTPEEMAADHVVSQVAAAMVPDPERAHIAAQRLAEHGANLLHKFDDEEGRVQESRRRMARRLTEVTPSELVERRRSFLPFGCPHRNQCLQSLFEQGNVLRPACKQALNKLYTVRASQHWEIVERQQEQEYVFKHLLVLYGFVFATILILFVRRRKQIRETHELKTNILKAVYHSPSIKAAVERELGGTSIGFVPPLRWRTLATFGSHGKQYRTFASFMRFARVAFCLLSVACLAAAPLYYLPVCVGFAAFLFWIAACSAPPTPVCVCCCCGMSTEDARHNADGTNYKLLTDGDGEACCSCCNGTGVCSPNCASCCGAGGCCGPDGCCGKDCCGGEGGCCGKGCCGADGCCGTGCCGADGCCGKGCCGADGCCGTGCCGADGCCGTGCCGAGGCCGGGCCCCSGGTCCGDSCCCKATKKGGKVLTGCCAGGCCAGGCCADTKCCCAGGSCCGDSCCCKTKKGTETTTTDNDYMIFEDVPIQIV